jgi:hypothetical protein
MNPSQDWCLLVRATMNKNRIPYSNAWKVCESEHPDWAILMSAMGRNRTTVSFFNVRSVQKSPPERETARKQFHHFVNEKIATGLDCNMAMNAAAREHPEIYAATHSNQGPGHVKITMPGQRRAEFQNDGETPAPVGSPGLKTLFWLTPQATQEEFEAAWVGNNSVTQPLNPAKIFTGLVNLAQKKNTGLGNDAAITQVKARFPRLWDAVEALSNEPV